MVVKCVYKKIGNQRKWIWCSVCYSSQLPKKIRYSGGKSPMYNYISLLCILSNFISFCSRSNRVYSQRMSIHLCMNPKHTIHLSRLDIDRIWHQLLLGVANESFSLVPSHNLIKCVDVAWRRKKKTRWRNGGWKKTKQNKTSNLCWQVLFSEQSRFFVSINEFNLISFSAR